TLYSLCLDYIKNHTEEIVSIEGVPFHPTIEVILNHVFTSTDSPLNSSFLSAVAKSYDDELRSANLPWTKVVLSKGASRSAIPSFIALSTEFPKFITHLDISRCNIDDDDLLLLKGFSNLKVLHMCHNPDISDIGISYLTNMAVSSFIGMPYLEGLNLSGLSRVTDKSLKCFRKLSSIIYLNISNTSVIDIVAQKFLTSLGFHQ
ncbi:hypothetical protein BDF20DRAFT_789215, partial [Mycotypha africana]|uniref:uncharacterized protein n=1 Tax=Mycotypha africana TaxID=64632 RepID=UPI0022FFD7AE